MNLGQSLFAIGALILLSMNIMSVNTRILRTDEVALNSKIGVLATSIGTSIIEDASKLPFDENTKDDAVSSLPSLTPAPFVNESPGVLDDFDDYNGYVKTDTVFTIPFTSICRVDYINPSDPNGFTTSKTWHKKLSIKIYTPFSKDTVQLSTIYSYWFFR
jgi:hypothetical protein